MIGIQKDNDKISLACTKHGQSNGDREDFDKEKYGNFRCQLSQMYQFMLKVHARKVRFA